MNMFCQQSLVYCGRYQSNIAATSVREAALKLVNDVSVITKQAPFLAHVAIVWFLSELESASFLTFQDDTNATNATSPQLNTSSSQLITPAHAAHERYLYQLYINQTHAISSDVVTTLITWRFH